MVMTSVESLQVLYLRIRFLYGLGSPERFMTDTNKQVEYIVGNILHYKRSYLFFLSPQHLGMIDLNTSWNDFYSLEIQVLM